jgi:hypothetical protein
VNGGFPVLLWDFDLDTLPSGCPDLRGGGSTPSVGSTVGLVCTPNAILAGGTLPCTVSREHAGTELLWRAAHDQTFAEGVVRTDTDGIGAFGVAVPRTALGAGVTVELVDWTGPVVVGVVGGPVPASVTNASRCRAGRVMARRVGGGAAPRHREYCGASSSDRVQQLSSRASLR